MWQKLFKNAKKSERRQPKTTRLNLEHLESRICLTSDYTAAVVGGVLTITQDHGHTGVVAPPANESTLSITESGGRIVVTGDASTGTTITSVLSRSFAASTINSIVFSQGAAFNDNLNLSVTGVTLPLGLTATIGKGTDSVISSANKLGSLTVTEATAAGDKAETVTSTGDVLGVLSITEAGGKGSTIAVSGLTGAAEITATQGAGAGDTATFTNDTAGIFLASQGAGADDSFLAMGLHSTVFADVVQGGGGDTAGFYNSSFFALTYTGGAGGNTVTAEGVTAAAGVLTGGGLDTLVLSASNPNSGVAYAGFSGVIVGP